ncbi:MAG: hypothetical protein WCC56_20470 [Erwinia sp.]
MNEDRISVNWKQLKGKVKGKWGDLKDGDNLIYSVLNCLCIQCDRGDMCT